MKNKFDVIIIGAKIIEESSIDDNILYNRIIECQTMTGYIVNSSYYHKLLQNFTEGLNKFLKNKDGTKYAIDIYWKLIQNDLWFTPKYKYVGQRSGFSDTVDTFINYSEINYFDLMKNFDYLRDENYKSDILILNGLNLNIQMKNFIKAYPYLILNNFCYKIPDEFRYKNESLLKLLDVYDIIQLQFNSESNNGILCIDSNSNIYSENISQISNCILINNKVITYLLNNPINFNKLNFKSFKTCRLELPIFLAANDKLYLDYYNNLHRNNV